MSDREPDSVSDAARDSADDERDSAHGEGENPQTSPREPIVAPKHKRGFRLIPRKDKDKEKTTEKEDDTFAEDVKPKGLRHSLRTHLHLPAKKPQSQEPSVVATEDNGEAADGASSSPRKHRTPLEVLKGKKRAGTLDDDVDFPDLSAIPSEKVVVRRYVWATKVWSEHGAIVRVQANRFTSGNTCTFHFMTMAMADGRNKHYVARQLKDTMAHDPKAYFAADVITAATCQSVAEAYNELRPVRQVFFLDSFLIKRDDGTWWGVEHYLRGKHRRYGGNKLGIKEMGQQRYHQAFSHYSYEFTKRRVLIIGFRGAGIYYRHGIIFSDDGHGFGANNLGKQGIDDFFYTHWCNKACYDAKVEMHMSMRLERHFNALLLGDFSTAEVAEIDGYVRNVRPWEYGATGEDLTIMGLTPEQFDRLTLIFKNLDESNNFVLGREELQMLFVRAEEMDGNTPKERAFINFAVRVHKELQKNNGEISFKDFLLCWTNNTELERAIQNR